MASSKSMPKMQALFAPKYCTPDEYEVVELPMPEIKDLHEVLVRVFAASINPHDDKEAKGQMKMIHNVPCVKNQLNQLNP
jgi:NADPH:quinone reductase-like Zn-dependent oxidoreductase